MKRHKRKKMYFCQLTSNIFCLHQKRLKNKKLFNMTTTKKVLFFIFAFCWMPMMMMAQSSVDSVSVFRETFDTGNPQVTSSYLFNDNGDWYLDSSLSVSSPACIHASMHAESGTMNLTTDAIPVSSSAMSDATRRVYMIFDHICKVSELDHANIYYRKATGTNDDGTFIWSTYRPMNFNQASSFYYGDGAADPYGSRTTAHFGSYAGGQFHHGCYGTGNNGLWKPNSNTAAPTNDWWRHEIFDITHLILDSNVTHLQIQFRLYKENDPSAAGTEVCAGWFIDNFTILLSNCELEIPRIALTGTVYAGGDANCGALNTNLRNNTGPYTITATIQDNDTINLNTILFTYEKNDEPTVTLQNNIASNTLTTSGHTVVGTWQLPDICYYDTIRYHIYVEDVHGSERQLDTFLIAWHDQTNIRNNDCRADSINVAEFPHCFITGQAQPVKFYFTNKSDAPNSPNNPYQTSLTVVLKVEDENHQVFHNQTFNWTGSLCMDVGDTLSLGSFSPRQGYNYITAYITNRNGQADGYHANDTIRFTGFACDSLLYGDYTVGGTNPDFPDMEAVKAALYFCGVDGPTTFHLRPGTYQDFDFQENYSGQSEVNTITFQGDSRDEVIITNNHTDAGTNVYGAVTLVNVKNFRFKDMTINGNANATSKGVLFRGNGSTNIVFDNCKITANTTNTTSNDCFAVGRTTAATASQGQTANPDTEISFNNCLLIGGNHGVYYIGSSSQKNAISFVNSDIKSCLKGIHTYYCNPVIQGNHISQCNMGSHLNFTGIYVEEATGPDINGNTIDSIYNTDYAIYLKKAANADFFIRNNHVKVGNVNYSGISVTNSSSTATVTGFLSNNEVILYPVTANSTNAVQIGASSSGLKLINNSLYVMSEAPYSNTAALMLQNSNNTYLYNNLLLNYCNSASGSVNYPLYLNGTSTATGTQNDLISASGAIVFKSVAMNSIAEMENNITTMTDNISLLPPMDNPTAMLLPTDFNGLECTRDADVLTDIRGLERTNPTYMGAYANPIPAVDAAITAMISPALGGCPEPTYNITLNIANKGSQTLNFASNSATVTVHSDSLNLNRTTNLSGSIAIMGSMSHVAANNISIPSNQPIDLTFIIHTNGDLNTSNDTLRMNFILEVAKPDYDETFTNGPQQTWTMEQISTGNKIGNWTFQEGSGVNPDIAPVYGTGRMFFNSKTFSAGTSSRAIMPVVDLSEAVNPILEMWFAHDRSGSSTANEGVTVKVSTDGGNTFNAITAEGQSNALIKRYKAGLTAPQWELYTFDLSDFVENDCIYIAFEAIGQQGNNINIDRIRLRNLLDNDIAITQVYARGESPNQYDANNVVKALARNEGSQDQTDIKVYLTVTGAAEQYIDSLTIPSLASGAETLISFPDHHFNVQEMKNLEVRSRDDQLNSNNAINWPMAITANIVNYADTNDRDLLLGDNNNIIRPCVRYTTDEELAVTAVKYYYDMSYIADPENGFKAFVANADGQIITTSDVISFDNLTQGEWNIIPINNFALTNMENEFYVGIEMLAKGNYLCAQIETPLRDSAFYYLESNGTYTPQTTGRFMIGALVDTPFVHDLAILSIDNPTSRCDLGHEHITVTVTNNGSQDLLPGTMMHYSVNGLTAVNEAMTDTLHSHETSTFTFNTVFDFTNNQIGNDVNYNIRVWATKDAQDRLQYNDTISDVIISKGKSMTPTVQETVNIDYYTSGTLTAHLPSSITEGVIGWFASTGYESWESLGYSDSTFQTPVIFFDTTFYANANPGYIMDTVIGQLSGSNTSTGAQPFVFTKGYSRGRTLFTENEMGNHHGPIASIGVYVTDAAGGENGIPIKIYLKETPLSIFPTTSAVDWENEKLGATLVVDEIAHFDQTGWHYFTIATPFNYNTGNLIVLTETNCADYCTGTGTQCNNCGTYVSGSTTYPKFRQTNCNNGFVQFKGDNVLPITSNYDNYSKRLTMAFRFADLECGSVKVPIHVHVPNIPTYDVKTLSLDHPVSGCAIYNENIKVSIKNMLNIPIPAGKVTVHAIFNNDTELTETINEIIESEDTMVVEFSQPYDFSAPTGNATFDYVIYTTMNNESAVYTGNDTISGTLTSTYTTGILESYTYEGSYTQPMDILQPEHYLTNTAQKYFFYDNDGNQVFSVTASSTSPFFTTPALYDSVTYWIEATTKTSGCTSRRAPIYINVAVPAYDLMTDSLVDPISFQCGISQNYPIKVQVTNTDTTSSSVIPAGTFNLTAQFTGTHNANGTVVINQPINSLESIDVTFADGLDIGSQTENRIYNYTIFSNSTGSGYVYRLNDTIRGTLYVPAYPTTTPATLTFENTNYGEPFTVSSANFGNNPYTYYYFYNNANDEIPFAQGQGFTTDPLYESAQYYYSGRIESPAFEELLTIGTGTQSKSAPFTFTVGSSYGRIQYSSQDMGGLPGRIDTMFVKVKTANTNNGTSVPVKIWMANANDTTYTGNTAPQIDWESTTAAAKLVFDGELAFDHTDWYAIPIQGGFDYDGRALFVYTEHDCDGGSCLTNYGISAPQFYGTSSSSQKWVMTKTTGNFSWESFRWNTQFKFNHTCESPKGQLIINTSQRAHDLEMESITLPITPNNDYTNAETVSIRIANHGSSSESNFPVKYQLENGTVVSQNYTGTLAPGTSGTLIFDTPIDLSDIYFATPLKVYTDLSNDNYRGNDTLTILLSKPTPTSSPTSTTAGLHITNVTFAGINNGNPSPFKMHPRDGEEMYSDFTMDLSQRGSVVKGQRYPLSVYHSFETNNSVRTYKAVYIDYNRDNVFANNELVTEYHFSNTNADSLMFLFVDIPDTAATGLTRMRVICSNATINNPAGAVGYYSQGETEDYAIDMLQPNENDLGITSYLHPIGNVCPDEAATMRVWVKNYGSRPQIFSEENALTVTSTVQRGNTSNTYTSRVTSDFVNPGDSIMVVIKPVNLSAIGDYTISSRLTYAPDQYEHNDTLSTQASTDSLRRILSIPFFDDFDHNTGTTATNLHFTSDWIVDQRSASHTWILNQGASENNPQAGPVFDHTQNTAGGIYAIVPGPGSANNWTSLTSRCINMHYNNNYPVELTFYKHFFGSNSNANFKMLVQIGSGENFVTVDSLTKVDGGQNSSSDAWTIRNESFIDFDEVAQLRFKVINHTGMVEPCLDDIGIKAGLPSIKLEAVNYPVAGECLTIGEVIKPQVVIRNVGIAPISHYDLTTTMASGSLVETRYDTIEHLLMPDETFVYTLDSGFVIDHPTANLDFFFKVHIDYELGIDTLNNRKHVEACTNWAVPELDNQDGVVLMQNEPNPASMRTRISYSLPESGKTILSIYSAQGQLLYSDTQDALEGMNFYDVNTSSFADGFYLYTLKFKDVVLTKKMVIQK